MSSTKPTLLRIDRLFTFDDLVVHYGGPRSLWEKCRDILPLLTIHDGIAVYLESAVDEFLEGVGQRLGLDSTDFTFPMQRIPVYPAESEPGFVTVAQAQRRYLGGNRSRR